MNPVFAYVYDECLADRRYERDLSLIEAELAQRGISGRIARLALFRNAKEMLLDLSRTGVRNIVFVGSDQTLLKNIRCVPDSDLTLGYLPLAPPGDLAELLSIPSGPPAVETLAARLIDVLDIGLANDTFFLTEAVFPAMPEATLEIEGRYRVHIPRGAALAMRNLGTRCQTGVERANPHDGLLEAVIEVDAPKEGLGRLWQKTKRHQTRIPCAAASLMIKGEAQAYIDGQRQTAERFRFALSPRKLPMITGKRRGPAQAS